MSSKEQADYEDGYQQMDDQENLDGNLDVDLYKLRLLRAGVLEAKIEQQKLRTQESNLDTRIAALEAQLDRRTRQLLGIGI